MGDVLYVRGSPGWASRRHGLCGVDGTELYVRGLADRWWAYKVRDRVLIRIVYRYLRLSGLNRQAARFVIERTLQGACDWPDLLPEAK